MLNSLKVIVIKNTTGRNFNVTPLTSSFVFVLIFNLILYILWKFYELFEDDFNTIYNFIKGKKENEKK